MQNCYPKKSSRDMTADQTERLTTKHIQTLGFLQEIVNENKQLKARVEELENELGKCSEVHALAEESQERIKQIQAQYLTRADEINEMLAQKHQMEIMQKVSEKLDAEQKWNLEKDKMLAEIEELKKMCNELDVQLEEYKQQDGKTEILDLKVKAVEQENDRLKNENDLLKQTTDGQLGELSNMHTLRSKNMDLEQQIAESKQKIKELQFTISRQERLLEENGGSSGSDQTNLIESLRKKLVKLHNEKMAFTLKETEYQDLIEQLQEEISQLKAQIQDLLSEKGTIAKQLKNALQELAKYRGKQSGDNINFKDFVQLKREMVLLKQENDELKLKIKGNKPLLPKLMKNEPINPSPSKHSVSSKSESSLVKVSPAQTKLQEIPQPMALIAARPVGSGKGSRDKRL